MGSGCKGGRKNRRGRTNKRMPNGHGGFVIVETLEITFDATDCGPKEETPAPSTRTTLVPSTTTDASSPATETATTTTVDVVDDSTGGPRVRRMARRRRPSNDFY